MHSHLRSDVHTSNRIKPKTMSNPQYEKEKSFSWRGIALIAVIALGLGAFIFWPSNKGGNEGDTKSAQVGGNDVSVQENIVYESDALNVGICTWPGYGTAILFNNGLLANSESRFTKEYGLRVNLNVMDDPGTNRPAFLSGDIDLIWATIDAYTSESIDMSAPPAYTKFAFATDCSAGGDVIVAVEGINSISDLRGKTVTFASLSPSHSFLLHILKAAGMTMDDVNVLPAASPIIAAEHFSNGRADVAVVWSPDDQTCIEAIKGAHVLTSTETASNLIYNVFLVKKSYLAEHSDRLVKFFEGWMVANAELKSGGERAKDAVAQALVDYMGWTSREEAKAAMGRVKFLTLGDNQNLFGMNPSYKGVTGKELWSKFSELYMASGDIQNMPPIWNDVFDRSILTSVSKDLKGAIHKAEGRKEFTPVTDKIANEPALTQKKVTVNFATGSAVLDNEAKNTIDQEFGDEVKAYRDARIRVVGNTDNTGSASVNKALSLKRAQAVKAYLVSEYDSDPNRFIVIGNGSKNAIEDGVEGSSEDYRRTDFELVQE